MRQFFTLLMIATTFLSACERPVEIDLSEIEPKIAVISNFAPGKRLEVQVSKTQSPLNTNPPEYIRDAKVMLYRGTNLLETLAAVPPQGARAPYYVTREFKPQLGEIYTLRVEAPGLKAVRASSSIPTPAQIRALSISDITVQPLPEETAFQYRVTLVFDDPAIVQNFYHLNFYQQIWNYRIEEGDTVITNNWLRRINFSRQNDNNSLIAYFDGGVLFNDDTFNGKTVVLSFVLETSIQPDRNLLGKMFAELRTVSKEYYLFHNSLSRQQTSPGGPLAEPVIIYNNIENGRGIFAGYSPTVDSVTILR